MREFDLSHRPTYTEHQILLYFRRLGLSDQELSSPIGHSFDVSTTSPTEAMSFLTMLQRRHLASIPFENLELHYSPHKQISIELGHVFEKIIVNGRGRGGYCMETSLIFGTLLRSLKYDVYAVGARANEAVQPIAAAKSWKGPKFDGFNHMVNIVEIDGEQFIVDVGFGASGAPTRPIPLKTETITKNVGTQSMRVLYSSVTQNTNARQKLWQYEFRNSDDQPWIQAYCFPETEFWPEDFAMMNHFISTSRTALATYFVVCAKMILDEQSGEIVGVTTMFDKDVKKRIQGQTEVLAELTSEEDRIKALSDLFGLELTEIEKGGIRGMRTEIL